MLKRIQVSLVILTLTIIYLSIHFYIMLNPQNIFYSTNPTFDKIEHTVSGFILGSFLVLLLAPRNQTELYIIVIAVIILLGLAFEIAESLTIYGGGILDTFTDLVCNVFGASLAVASLGSVKYEKFKGIRHA